MGGLGSGGYRHGQRHARAEDCYILSVKTALREMVFDRPEGRVLRWDDSTVGAVIFGREHGQLGFAFQRGTVCLEHIIPVLTTPCRFGGVRYWFRCPECGRRAIKLYFPMCAEIYPTGPGKFACRYCWQLGYYLRDVKDPSAAASFRAARLSEKVTGGRSFSLELGAKPPWMRQHVYDRMYGELLNERNTAAEELIADYCRFFPDSLGGKLRAEGGPNITTDGVKNE